MLTPGRYVGAAEVDEDEMPFEERFGALKQKLDNHFQASDETSKALRALLARL